MAETLDVPNLVRLRDELVAAADHKEEMQDYGSKIVSLRLGITTHIVLERLSERLRDNKHALAVELLAAAAIDLYNSLEMPHLTPEEVQDWMVANMKGVRRMPEHATAAEMNMVLEEAAQEARHTNWEGK